MFQLLPYDKIKRLPEWLEKKTEGRTCTKLEYKERQTVCDITMRDGKREFEWQGVHVFARVQKGNLKSTWSMPLCEKLYSVDSAEVNWK